MSILNGYFDEIATIMSDTEGYYDKNATAMSDLKGDYGDTFYHSVRPPGILW